MNNAACLVTFSINYPSKTKETTLLPSNEQTGTGGDELAIYKSFCNCFIINIILFMPVVL